jgi:hypothetical protein
MEGYVLWHRGFRVGVWVGSVVTAVTVSLLLWLM